MDVVEPRPVTRRGAVKLDRLRLDGFKSFADRAEIDIEPGLTGIVGPNGCGKSNLVEALKWVLGETSAKRMRGSGMDDVIFGGTEKRSPRNTSEVGLLLDNRLRTAPTELNDSDTLEIVRRIERGQGTTYRANGRGVRQKDVQILFQDNASGAGSSAIVSQGKVIALISAKATDRRSVLEEAAGVSGLSSRRNEAKNKLRQSEQNLERADASLAEVTGQAGVLRRQARQLQRWREIDGRIRKATATMLLVRLAKAAAELKAAEEEHLASEAKVTQAMIDANTSAEAREKALAAIEPLREARAAAETALARAMARLEGIENETERRRREIEELRARMHELTTDRAREDQNIDEATRAVDRLRGEQFEIAEIRAAEAESLEVAAEAVETARAAVEQADAAATALGADLATREASRAAALKRREDVERRLAVVEQRLATAQGKLDAAVAAMPDGDAVGRMAEEFAELEARLEVATEAVLAAEQATAATRAGLEAAAEQLAAARSRHATAVAEARGLEAVSVSDMSRDPVSGRIRIEPGYEAAVAAALGDALSAGTDGGETQWWTASGQPPALSGTTLDGLVTGVPELASALAAVVVVDDAEVEDTGRSLPAGAVAVTRSGLFFRWDGLRGRASSNAVETGLRRVARIRELRAEIAAVEPEVAAAEQAKARLEAGLEDGRRLEAEARNKARSVADAVRVARDALAKAQAAGEQGRRTVAVAEAEVAGIRAERQGVLQELREAGEALSAIPVDDAAKAAVDEARKRLQAARDAESAAKIALERLTNEQTTRRNRLEAVMRDIAEWTRRLAVAKERRQDLSRRDAEAQKQMEEIAAMTATPAEAVAEAKAQAEAAREGAAQAARKLHEAETVRDTLERQAREREAFLSGLRENRARIIAAIAQGQAAVAAVTEATRERLSCGVDELPGIAQIPEGAKLPEADAAELAVARLEAERQNFGPVNFLAEQEAAEQEKRLEEINKGRDEVRQAIVKLRQAIKEIEEEASQKLEETFRIIDANFGQLFRTLFGGGQAHLKLVGEDILESGLEIYASPPGKRLQILSLLSGGEQTLTAMALIFAAFLSNPAPICVLDEADAALDDSNTDRLVRMVESMALNDATRFLVITHNPLTMARMNRLYGVTMQERGVSSVTKVDLDRAIQIADA